MLNFISGKLVSAKNGMIVVECNGIGYELYVSNTTMVKTNSLGTDDLKLYCYLNVREDSMVLYGFYSIEEKNMFLKLISISGVGPKAAMSILSGIELSTLVTSIITKDIKTLSKVKGIGKKTAERIVLELKESISLENADMGSEIIMEADMDITADKDIQDAVMALRSLGLQQKEAINAVRKVKDEAKNIEDLIQKALKSI